MTQTKEEAFAILKEDCARFDIYNGPLVLCNIADMNKIILRVNLSLGNNKNIFVRWAVQRAYRTVQYEWKSADDVKKQIERGLPKMLPQIQPQNAALIANIYLEYAQAYFTYLHALEKIAASNHDNDTKIRQILDLAMTPTNQMSKVPFYNNINERVCNRPDLQ